MRRRQFSLQCKHPYPFNICYCSICRKTAGSGGYGINLGGDAETLQVTGEGALKTYQAKLPNPDTGKLETSPAERRFCGTCGTPLWVWDPRWPELNAVWEASARIFAPVVPELQITQETFGSLSPAVSVLSDSFDFAPNETTISVVMGLELVDFDGGSGPTTLDDFTFQVSLVPRPAAFPLMLLGAGSVLALGRRRGGARDAAKETIL